LTVLPRLAGHCLVSLASGAAGAAIAVDETGVYWGDSTNSALKKVGLQGGPSATLASDQTIFGIAVRGGRVYWINQTGGGAILSLPETGGGVATTVVSGQPSPERLAVDGTNVYWTNYGGAETVMSAPLGGGTPTAP